MKSKNNMIFLYVIIIDFFLFSNSDLIYLEYKYKLMFVRLIILSKDEVLLTLDSRFSCRQSGQLFYHSKIILFRLSQEQEEDMIFVIISLALYVFFIECFIM